MSALPWWDGRHPETFFRTAYFRGDHSLEGWVEGLPMTLAERTEREALGAGRLLKLTREDIILDCPCGYGRHSVFLSREGFQVIGVDLNPAFLDVARTAARRVRAEKMSFVQGDMRRLPMRSGSVTAVLNLVLSFGFFSDEENLEVLREFSRVLYPGGRLLLHTDVNPARIEAGTYGDRPERTLEGGARLRVSEMFDSRTRRLEGSWEILERDGGARRASYSIRIYDLDELGRMLWETGLEMTAVHGGLDPGQEPLTRDSQELVVIARKYITVGQRSTNSWRRPSRAALGTPGHG